MLCAALVLSIILSACGNNGASEANGKVTLTLFSTMSNSGERKAFEEVIRDFEKEHQNIRIDANFPGNSYEDMIRVKMGANDMPDLFDTHGWAKLRYSEYVADLKEMDWVKQLDPSLDQILKDKDGKVYAYPLNQAKDGLSFNANLLKEYGIKVPKTLNELKSALQTVKEKVKETLCRSGYQEAIILILPKSLMSWQRLYSLPIKNINTEKTLKMDHLIGLTIHRLHSL